MEREIQRTTEEDIEVDIPEEAREGMKGTLEGVPEEARKFIPAEIREMMK
jgi:hypothetical protein